MHNQSDDETHTLDTHLASFADELINGGSPSDSSSRLGNEDLEGVVRQLHAEIRLVYPGADIRERIHSNLVQQWNQTQVAKKDSFLQRWWHSVSGDSWSANRQNQRLSAFALAGAAVLVLVFLIVTSVTGSQPLPASAGGDIAFGAVAIGLGILVAVAALFFSRKR